MGALGEGEGGVGEAGAAAGICHSTSTDRVQSEPHRLLGAGEMPADMVPPLLWAERRPD